MSCKHALDMYKKGVDMPGQTRKKIWKQMCIVQSAVHPDTGKIVLFPFRMSCYVISNLVVTAGMLTPNMRPAGVVFWHFANQSLNVAVNTANANKTKLPSWKQLATAYLGTVTACCTIALSLDAMVPRLKRFSPATRTIMVRLVPFVAVGSATMLNVTLMRSNELHDGIEVFDAHTNEPIGFSKEAAKTAVAETAISRVLSAAPVMVIPPLILYQLQKGVLRGKSLSVTTAVNLGIIAITGFATLPFALGVFPQKRYVNGSSLEPRFGNRQVWFNRGV